MIDWKIRPDGGEAILSGSRAEVEADIETVKRRYHPTGYGTTVLGGIKQAGDQHRAHVVWYSAD